MARTRSTDEAREAEKGFRDSIKGVGIEGVGRGIEALSRIQESRNLRMAGTDIAVKKKISVAGKENAPGGFAMQEEKVYQSQLKMEELMRQVAENTRKAADKDSVELIAANVGGGTR